VNFDPQKFAIGVIDLFAVLLPGAILVYLTKDTMLSEWVRGWAQLATDSWIVFGLASYLTGHLIFLLGATIDGWLYEPLRDATHRGQIGRLSDGNFRSWQWLQWLARRKWLFGRSPDAAIEQVLRIKAAALAPLPANTINAFQWSKARLTKDNPSGFASVQRFEADSKFFRSFGFALALLALVYAVECKLSVVLLCVLLTPLVLWRYVDQRFKSTQQAYWLVITLEAAATGGVRLPKGPPPGAPTHAGGVVYRKSDETTEYLIVQARWNPRAWVLPKGHIEPGEDPRATAVREVLEETGWWARVEQEIEDYLLGTDDKAAYTRFYLMTPEGTADGSGREDRSQEWRSRAGLEAMVAGGTFHSESMDVICGAETFIE
jgi:8-oxo-dGTP pyrophosphatase MutT (NUDIX family)